MQSVLFSGPCTSTLCDVIVCDNHFEKGDVSRGAKKFMELSCALSSAGAE